MSVTIPRALSPSTNPAGLLASAGVIYAAVAMIYNAFQHHGVIDTNVVIAAVGAIGALFTRQAVTPVADPKNGVGVPLVPLVPAVPVAPGTSSVTTVVPPAPPAVP